MAPAAGQSDTTRELDEAMRRDFAACDRGSGQRLQRRAFQTAQKGCLAPGAGIEGSARAREHAARAPVTFLQQAFAK
jgi:hypothetical protein